MCFSVMAYGDISKKVSITTDDIGILRDIAAFLDERITQDAQRKNYRRLKDTVDQRLELGEAISELMEEKI